MSANIFGEMVYSFAQPMWHGITEPSLIPMTAEEIMNTRFGGGFEIFLRPITVELNGGQVETGDFAIVRGKSAYDNKEIVFDYCTERYHPLQPIDVARSFDENVQEPAETMAFLKQGNDMFISWKMPSFEVLKGDEIDMYGIVRTGFDTKNAARLFTSTVRPVCWNTITFAEGWAKANTDGQGRGEIWKGKGINKNLLRDLGYWMSHVQEHAKQEVELLKSLFSNFAQTPINNDDEARGLLFQAYPDKEDVSGYYPAQLRDKKQEAIESFNDSQKGIRDGIFSLFSGEGTQITPDYWGMMNSTSEYFCHVQPSKKPIAESVMFGGRQKNIMSMVKVLTRN